MLWTEGDNFCDDIEEILSLYEFQDEIDEVAVFY